MRSLSGNSSRARFDAEYTDAPFSLTVNTRFLSISPEDVTKLRVSCDAVPSPTAMASMLYFSMRDFSVRVAPAMSLRGWRRVYYGVVEQIALRVEHHGLATGSVTGVESDDSQSFEWGSEQELPQIVGEYVDSHTVGLFFERCRNFIFDRRAEQTFCGIFDSVGNDVGAVGSGGRRCVSLHESVG